MKLHQLMVRWACISACTLGLAATSMAAPVVKTGLSLLGALGDANVPGTPAWARSQWMGLVTDDSIRSEGFERTGSAALTGETFQDLQPKLEFRPAGGGDATLATMLPTAPLGNSPPPPTPNPGVVIESNISIAGRFNTTPNVNPGHWWESTGDFTIVFDAPVSVFGLFITDSADFAGSLRLVLDDDGSNPLTVVAEQNGTQGDGSLLFFGFADSSKSYSRITFDIRQTKTVLSDYDVFGFDDLLIGAARTGNGNGTVPEPGTLALVGASLLGLVIAGRRRRT